MWHQNQPLPPTEPSIHRSSKATKWACHFLGYHPFPIEADVSIALVLDMPCTMDVVMLPRQE
jgi:hypothetical protein